MTDTASSSAEKRLFPRWTIGEQGAIRVGGVSSACTAVDISAGGVKVKTHARVAVDEQIQFQLPGVVPMEARVVRVEKGGVAVQFTGGPQYLFR